MHSWQLDLHKTSFKPNKFQISAQNSEREGGNKAHKHSGGIWSNIPQKKKKKAQQWERVWTTLTVSREGGGSATAIKGEGVTISYSSHSDRIALFR